MGPKKRLRVKKANKTRFKSHQETSINSSDCLDNADSIEDGSDGRHISGCGINGCGSVTTTCNNMGPLTLPTSVTTCTTQVGVSPKVGVSSRTVMSSKMRVSPKVGVSHTVGMSPKVDVSSSSVPASSSPGTARMGVSPGTTGVGVSPKVNGSFTVTYDYTAEQEGDHTHKSMEELAQLFSFQNEKSKFYWKTSTPPAPARSVKRLRPLPDSAVTDSPSKTDGNISHLVATLRARISKPHPPDVATLSHDTDEPHPPDVAKLSHKMDKPHLPDVAKQSHKMDKPHLPDVAKHSHDMDKPLPPDVAKQSHDMDKPLPPNVAKQSHDMDKPLPPNVANLSHDMNKPHPPEFVDLCIDRSTDFAMQDQLDGFLEEEDLMGNSREEADEEQSFWMLAAQQLCALTSTSSGTGNNSINSSTSIVTNSSTGVSTVPSKTQDTGHWNHLEVSTIEETLPNATHDTVGTTVDDLLPVDMDEFQSEDVNVMIREVPKRRGPNDRLRGRNSCGTSQLYKNSIPRNSFSQGSALQYSVSPRSVSQLSASQDLVSVNSVSERSVSLRHVRTFDNSSACLNRMDVAISTIRQVGPGEVRRGSNHRFEQGGCHSSWQSNDGSDVRQGFSMSQHNVGSTRGGQNERGRGREDGYGRVRQDGSQVRQEGGVRGKRWQGSKVSESSNGSVSQDTRNRNYREGGKRDFTNSKKRVFSDRGPMMNKNTMCNRILEDSTNSKPCNGTCADKTHTGDDMARATGDNNLDAETECDLLFEALVKQSQ